MLASVGNLESNLIYLAKFSNNDWDLLLTGDSSHETRRAFLYQKFVTKRWCAAMNESITSASSPSLGTESFNLIEFDDFVDCSVHNLNDYAITGKVLDANRCEDLFDCRPNSASLDPFSGLNESVPASDPWAPSIFDFSFPGAVAVDCRGAVDPFDNQDCMGSWDIDSKISTQWVDDARSQSNQSSIKVVALSSTAISPRKSECVICLERPPSHLSIPCGHKAYCELCSLTFGDFKDCPLCRTPITGMVKVFDV